MNTVVTDYFDNLAELITSKEPESTPLGLQTILLFGEPGSGKTTVAAGFPKHLYIDLENSATNQTINALNITTWVRFKEFVQAILEKPERLQGHQTLVIDTVTDLWELCRKHELAARNLREMPDDFGRTLVAMRREFKSVIDGLMLLHRKGVMGTVFIAHEELEEVKSGFSSYQVARPRVTDKDIKDYIAAKPQMVLRCIKSSTNPNTGAPLQKVEFLIQTKPQTEQAVIKDRTNRLPPYVRTSYESLARQYERGVNSEAESENEA